MTIFLQDRPLLDAFRRGERSALEKVYEALLPDVITVIRGGFVLGDARVRGEPDRAKQLDLAHDVFVKAFAERARLSYDGLRPYRPFLLRIARNLLVDRLRASGREVPVDDAALQAAADDLPEADAPGAEESLHFERLRRATQAFLAEQDPELVQFVRLRFEEGRSQYEVVEAMKITRRRVRTLETKARSGLEAFLAAQGLKWP